MASFKIENSIAFVTAANRKSGIGRAIVDALLKAGAKKIYATSRDAAQLDELVTESHGKVVAVKLDVTNSEDVKALGSKYTDVNLLINNAGYASTVDPVAGNLDEMKMEMAVNYFAVIEIVQSFASVLKKNSSEGIGEEKGSAIVNINSIGSFVSSRVLPSYSASKAAAHSITQAQREVLRESLVIGVYPGPIDTALAHVLDMEKEEASVVGVAVVDALKNGTETVFPDRASQTKYDAWKKELK